MHTAIVFTIISLFYPVFIKFKGIDTVTTGTMFIFILFCLYISKLLVAKQRINIKFGFIVLSLVVVASISTLSVPSALMVRSFRQYLYFTSSLLLFLVIVNHYSVSDVNDRKNKIEALLFLLLLLTSIEIILGTMLYLYPKFGNYLAIFTSAAEGTRTVRVQSGVRRFTGLFLTPESTGEILVVLLPIVLYKLAKHRTYYYYIMLGVFTGGVVISVTRSGIVLFVIGFLIYSFTNRKYFDLKVGLILTYTAIPFGLIIVYYFSYAFDEIFYRFSQFALKYNKTGLILESIDRPNLTSIFHFVISNLRLFGHGMVTLVNSQGINFHNLYLTVLHRIGLVGFVLYFALICKILVALIRSYKMEMDGTYEKLLINSCIFSLALLLINEVKYEYMRHASYHQVIVLIFGIYFLVAKSGTGNKQNSGPRQSDGTKHRFSPGDGVGEHMSASHKLLEQGQDARRHH